MNPQYTVNGTPVSQTTCGTVIGFDVPGYNRAWIIVSQDGHVTFDGPMDLPMPLYRLRCPEDIGFFQVAAYEVINNNVRGTVIGQTSITVAASAQTSPLQQPYQPIPGGTPPPVGQPPYTPLLPPADVPGGPPIQFIDDTPTESGFFSGLDTTTLALLAVGALLVLPPLFRRKGQS